ncbi:MAG: response regulator, partial [Desulfobacterales bacterium]|nr:response regulator [Desulfobacterales bacterium]
DDYLGIIIPKYIKHPMGIVIHKVLGTITTEIELDTKTLMAPGIFGTAIIDNKINILPDMYRLFEMAAPELYGKENDPSTQLQKKKRILIVDDTAFFRLIESEYVQSAGYDVIQAENGKQALSCLEEEHVDALILDIVMPHMDGWEVIKTIRTEERWKHLPVMAVTSLFDEENAQKGFEAGFNAWEAKLNKERLLEKLSKILA